MTVHIDLTPMLATIHQELMALRGEVSVMTDIVGELRRQVSVGNGSPSLSARITSIERRCESTHAAITAERHGVAKGRAQWGPWVGVITALIAAAAAVLVAVVG